MDKSDYRREYAAYCSALERERYNYHAGVRPGLQLEPIYDRYADLWTQEAIADLHHTWSETPAQFETERAGLRALMGAARLNYADRRAREVTDELSRCVAGARLEWDGEDLAAHEAQDRITEEPDAVRRRELAARWLDAVRRCDDLQAARFESLQESARLLGFGAYHTLCEDAAGISYEKIAASADLFLERTANAYMSHLSEWTARQLPPAAPRDRPYTDSLVFRRLAWLDHVFPAHKLQASYRATLANLGISAEAQKNIRIDEARPSDKGRSACFATSPPQDVRLVVGAHSGANSYLEFFYEASRAQHFAWSSSELAARHPEFIYAPDDAARSGHAFLFCHLLFDALWLADHLGVRPTEAHPIARSIALREAYEVRCCCAKLRYAFARSDSRSASRSEHLAETYAALHTEASGFRYRPEMYLLDSGGEGLAAAISLRARLFAVALNEHLRARHGYRWWKARAAGDELIDMWNTAARHPVEELAGLTGIGELDFNLLGDTLMTAMKGNN